MVNPRQSNRSYKIMDVRTSRRLEREEPAPNYINLFKYIYLFINYMTCNLANLVQVIHIT